MNRYYIKNGEKVKVATNEIYINTQIVNTEKIAKDWDDKKYRLTSSNETYLFRCMRRGSYRSCYVISNEQAKEIISLLKTNNLK